MKITATKEKTVNFYPEKLARDYFKQLKEIRDSHCPESTMEEVYEMYAETLPEYAENLLSKSFGDDGYVYNYDDCILLQQEMDEEIYNLIEKEDKK